MLVFLLLDVPATNARDARHVARQAGGMILTEYELQFVRDSDCWRCVEWPDLVMLPGERYRVGEQSAGSLGEALRHLEAGASTRHH